MRGKTNIYNYMFGGAVGVLPNSITESDIVASNGLTYQFHKNDEGTWELAILTSGTISFKKSIDVDAWVVGGGKNGTNGSFASVNSNVYNGTGGNGGNGGQVIYNQISIAANTSYNIVIGNNSNNTSGFNITATSGGGCIGGSGGSVSGGDAGKSGATAGQSSTLYAFYAQGSSYFYPNVTFGAGGGGGRASGYNTGVSGGPHIPDTNLPTTVSITDGGNTGGGVGGDYNNTDWVAGNGTAGHANYGAGGGGGAGCGNPGGTTGTGGAGGTGIIILHPKNFKGWNNDDKIIFNNGAWNNNLIGSWVFKPVTVGGGYTHFDQYEIINGKAVIGTHTYPGAYNTMKFTSLYGTSQAINLTNYSSLKIKIYDFYLQKEWDNVNADGDINNVYIGLSTLSAPSGTWTPDASQSSGPPPGMSTACTIIYKSGDYTIDISSLTGSYYLWMSSASKYEVSTTIEAIWLE